MKKTIEQILNDILIGKKIVTGDNEIGIIKAVKINANETNSLGYFKLEINNRLKKYRIQSNFTEIDFVEIDSKKNDNSLNDNLYKTVLEFPISAKNINVLKRYNLLTMKEIVEFREKNNGFSSLKNAGKSFCHEMDFLLKHLGLILE